MVRFWFNPTTTAQLLPDDARRRQQICGDIDRRGFGWQIWLVASSGFFTESYNLFTTNVVLPMLAYIYWNTDDASDHESSINITTLLGSMVGQLVFGFLADLYGRRKLYGTELVFVVFGTLGLAGSASGYSNSMDIMGWLIFYRLFVGIGIGAEYPLSAVITAEFAPVQSRARMMVAVTLMQPLGQLAAAGVGLAVLVTLGKDRGMNSLTESPDDHEAAAAIADRIWRIVVGVGAIPAMVAIIFRVTIPESPRFTLDVAKDGKQALKSTQEYLGEPVEDDYRDIELDMTDSESDDENHDDDHDDGTDDDGNDDHEGDQADDHENENAAVNSQAPTTVAISNSFSPDKDAIQAQEIREPPHDQEKLPENGEIQQNPVEHHLPSHVRIPRILGEPQQFSKADLKQYFWIEGNWRYLAACSLCWFCLDFAFYGIGIGNPRVIAQIWASAQASSNTTSLPEWKNPASPGLSIYDTLYQNSLHYILTISIGSLLGSLIMVKAVDYISRKAAIVWSFCALCILFAVMGGSYFAVVYTDLHALIITLYALLQLVFNIGPNTLIFLIPAEIFPTRYRATCHGIAAASGKLGSIIVQAFLPKVSIDRMNSTSLGWLLIAFAGVMAFGTVFAWAWIPELQYPRNSKPLEADMADLPVEVASIDEEAQRARYRGNKIPTKTLETLARGRWGEDEDRNRVGFRNNWMAAIEQTRGVHWIGKVYALLGI